MSSIDLPNKMLDESAEWAPLIEFLDDRLPLFPLDTFPGWLRRWVEGVAVATGTPEDLAGMLGLCLGYPSDQ